MPLLYVLWAVALLTIIGTTLLGSGNVAYRQTRNLADVAQQEALAEAALNRAVLALLEPRQERRWRVDGVPQTFAFAGTSMTVAIQDELGRVDINQADTPLITAALRAGGLPAQAASELSDKILDWRDQTGTKRLNGAKEREYTAAGLSYGPRNGPYQSVDELRLVLGVTPQIFRAIEAYVTVWSARPMIDPQFAPEKLLSALYGGEGGTGMRRPQTDRPGLLSPGISLDGRAFSVRIELGGGRSQEAVIRISGDRAKPYWLLSWKMKKSQ